MARSNVISAQTSKKQVKSNLLPEDYLDRALNARSPTLRAKYARLGLAIRGPLERTTHAMLLRQLYMAYYETRRFRKARDVALQALELGIMVDVIHQDVARAFLGLGQKEDAIGHLRLAARRGPASRRAFHLWTLGSHLFLMGRYVEASTSLSRAARWGTTDRPLYQAHAALARLARGESVPDALDLFKELEQAPCGQGYGRFVLGQLAFYLHLWDDAKHYLEVFVERVTQSRPTMVLSLAGELESARRILTRMSSNLMVNLGTEELCSACIS